MMFNSTINLRTNVEHPISDIILVFTHQHPIPEIPMEIAMETTSTCTNFRSFQVTIFTLLARSSMTSEERSEKAMLKMTHRAIDKLCWLVVGEKTL